ncbi:transcription factor HES-5-like protein [Labeo rohita]|uniref:Transcription factor HES-5-like protein n=1 Tax=Labeo rohita TaxID=84645 RepID=A0A498LXF8_LABRO|nr:transcription factor HES-5-like protein [Labeo rohita]
MFSSLPSASKVTYIHLYECGYAGHFKFPQVISKHENEKTIFGKDAQRSYQLKLKCLLAPEFLKQQPDSKLEKAEILEMMLNFMQCHNFTSHAVNSGFSMCEQNRRESVLPDQKTFSKDMNVNKSAI